MSDLHARLLHPAYIVPALPAGCMILDHDQVRADMRDAAAEIARLQEAKRRALKVADERAIEANGVRAENERLREENAALADGLRAYWGNLFDSRLKYVLEIRRSLAAEQT